MSEQTTTSAPYKRRVLFEAHRDYDLEAHLSKITIEDKEYADIREFIPSLTQYGRGIILPPPIAVQMARAILQQFEEVSDVDSGTDASQ